MKNVTNYTLQSLIFFTTDYIYSWVSEPFDIWGQLKMLFVINPVILLQPMRSRFLKTLLFLLIPWHLLENIFAFSWQLLTKHWCFLTSSIRGSIHNIKFLKFSLVESEKKSFLKVLKMSHLLAWQKLIFPGKYCVSVAYDLLPGSC